MNGLETIYLHHHTKARSAYGTVHLRDARSVFLVSILGKGKDILDIGVRDGELASYYVPGNTVDGIDIDSTALKIAAERGIHTIHQDLAHDWQIQKRYDTVVAGEVLEHLYYPERIMEKAARALKKDGLFVGTVPNAFSLKRRLWLLFLNKNHTSLNDPTHINHFTVKELREMLERYFERVTIIGFGKPFIARAMPQTFAFDLFFIAQSPKQHP